MSVSGPTPTAAIVLVGQALLTGELSQTHGLFLLGELHKRHVFVQELRVVGSDEPALAGIVARLRARVDRLFVVGGVGPTHQDISVRALAHALHIPLVVHPELALRLDAHFGPNADPYAVRRLAEVPEGAQVLLDTVSLVPIVTLGNVTVLPGTPAVLAEAWPQALGDWHGPSSVQRTWRIRGRPIDVAGGLAELQQRFEPCATDAGIWVHVVDSAAKAGVTSVVLRLQARDLTSLERAEAALSARFVDARLSSPG